MDPGPQAIQGSCGLQAGRAAATLLYPGEVWPPLSASGQSAGLEVLLGPQGSEARLPKLHLLKLVPLFPGSPLRRHTARPHWPPKWDRGNSLGACRAWSVDSSSEQTTESGGWVEATGQLLLSSHTDHVEFPFSEALFIQEPRLRCPLRSAPCSVHRAQLGHLCSLSLYGHMIAPIQH